MGQNEKKQLSHYGELWDNMKRNNIHIMGIPGGEKKEKGKKVYLKQ